MLGQEFSWTRTALNLEAWTPRSSQPQAWTLQVTKMFHGWTPTLLLGRVFWVLFLSPACGCRFGSGPGRFWVGICRPWFCPWLCSVSVRPNSGRKIRAPTPKPAVIRRLLLDKHLPQCSGSSVPCIALVLTLQRLCGCLSDAAHTLRANASSF